MKINTQNLILITLIIDTLITSTYNAPNYLPLILSKLFNIFLLINIWNKSKIKSHINKNHYYYIFITYLTFCISSYITGSIKPILFITQVIFYFLPLYVIGLNMTKDTLFKWIVSLQYLNIIFSLIGYLINPITFIRFARYSSIFSSGNSSGLVSGLLILINLLFFKKINNYFNNKYKIIFIISTLNSILLILSSTNRLSILSLLICLIVYLIGFFYENFKFNTNKLVITNISKIKPLLIFFLIIILFIFLNPSLFYDLIIHKSFYLAVMKQDVSNGRFEVWAIIFDRLNLFGSQKYLFIESTLFSTLYRYGIIPGMLFFLPYIYLFFSLIIKRKIKLFKISFYLLIQLLIIWIFETNFVVLTNLLFTVLLGYESRKDNSVKFRLS